MAFRKRAFQLGLIATLLATMSVAPSRASRVPKAQWTPGGVNYGDPDPGNGGVDLLRMSQQLLFYSLQRLTNPATPIVVSTMLSSSHRTR